jgi:hypothetical protein
LSILADEDVVIPDYFTEADITEENPGPSTYQKTWINQIWKGTKINARGTKLNKDVYVDVKPMDFQFRSGSELYGAKLPVCGQVFNNRNSESMSLVDMMKPHQIGFNIAINQLYEIQQREIGRFFLMDMNLLPNLKDWGGEKGLEKFMLVARSLGVAPIDSSPANRSGATFNQLSVQDLDETTRMMSRIRIGEAFANMAMAQVGFNPQRLGEIGSSSTATGTSAALTQSYAQTESYFTNFSNYKRRCLEMSLMISQYVQSQKEEVRVNLLDDSEDAFIILSGDELVGHYWMVNVSDSKQDLNILNTMRQAAVNNPNLGLNPLDMIEIIKANSPAELKRTLEVSVMRQEQQQEAQNAMKQDAIEKDHEEKMAKLQLEDTLNQRNNDTKLEVAYIDTFALNKNNLADTDNNDIPQIAEYDKYRDKAQNDRDKIGIQKTQQILNQQNKAIDQQTNVAKLALKDKELEVREKIANKQLEASKINKNQYDQNNKKPGKKTPKK